jgi:beta-lactamase superfamily II metal-dependent hydrolase
LIAAPLVTPPLLATPQSSIGVVAARGNGAFFNITLLPAGHGDSLWIEYGEGATTSRWLIDCGTSQTSRVLLERVEALPDRERRLELFVLSHIDSDHIGGALKFLKAASPRAKHRLTIGDVWFNGWRHISGQLGARQAEMFSTAIQDLKLPWNQWRGGDTVLVDGSGDLPECVLPGGMRLTLLSPTRAQLDKLAPAWKRELKRYGFAPGTRVDYGSLLRGSPAPSSSTDVDSLAGTTFDADDGAPNGTSIAVLAEFGGARALLAADAHAPVLVASIRRLLQQRGETRLKIDAFKVSHHASQRNISTELIELLDCRRYLVSTNGDHFSHPDRQAIARIIKSGGPRAELCFNYRSRFTEVWQSTDLQERYAFQATFPAAEGAGCSVSLL